MQRLFLNVSNLQGARWLNKDKPCWYWPQEGNRRVNTSFPADSGRVVCSENSVKTGKTPWSSRNSSIRKQWGKHCQWLAQLALWGGGILKPDIRHQEGRKHHLIRREGASAIHTNERFYWRDKSVESCLKDWWDVEWQLLPMKCSSHILLRYLVSVLQGRGPINCTC